MDENNARSLTGPSTHAINNVEIFKTGEHPGTGAQGIAFGTTDLDGIVVDFISNQRAGRVPLKLGHTADAKPGAPALGWVSSLRRVGNKLLADFTGIPTIVFDAVKRGLYRFVSIELLKPKGEGASYKLDAVALLGADIPAVDGLSDLQKLTAARAAVGEALLCFSTDFAPPGDEHGAAESLARENAALRAKLAASEAECASFAANGARQVVNAHRRDISDVLDKAVRDRRMVPAHRERLLARIADDQECLRFTRDDALLFCDAHNQTASIALLFEHTAKQPPAGAQIESTPPHEILAAQARALFAAKRAPDIFSALELAIKEDPSARAAMVATLDHDLVGGFRGA